MLSGCRSSQYRRRIGELFEAGKLTIDYCRNMRELACEWLACAFVLAGIIYGRNYRVAIGRHDLVQISEQRQETPERRG